jgi:hypothetical protein
VGHQNRTRLHVLRNERVKLAASFWNNVGAGMVIGGMAGTFFLDKPPGAWTKLRRKRPKGGQRSLRDISAELAARGHLNERGQPFSAASIKSMLLK